MGYLEDVPRLAQGPPLQGAKALGCRAATGPAGCVDQRDTHESRAVSNGLGADAHPPLFTGPEGAVVSLLDWAGV